MKLRDWATPLTMGMFCLMSLTGILLFFHLDTGLNKPAHEWLGWLMIIGVVAHAVINWTGVKRYLVSSRKGQVIIGVCLLVLAASFISLPSDEKDMSPPRLAMQAILQAPISTVAPLTGHDTAQVMADLAAAGITLPTPQSTLEQATGNNRGLQGKALRVLFR